jgi:hypothetical protein
MQFWPQVLVGLFLLSLVVMGVVRHGKTFADPKPVNAMVVIWGTFTFAAVLGAGGFWRF